jgi:hypothetical protein
VAGPVICLTARQLGFCCFVAATIASVFAIEGEEMDSTMTLFSLLTASGTRTKAILALALLATVLVALAVLAGDASAGQKFR